jgi:hypothetical protein
MNSKIEFTEQYNSNSTSEHMGRVLHVHSVCVRSLIGGYVRKATILFFVAINLALAANLVAQVQHSNFSLLLQATANYENMTLDFTDIGPGIRVIKEYNIRRYYLSINPTFRTGTHTAIELELGFQYTSVRQSDGGPREPLIDKASILLPHLLVTFNALDSVFVPFIRGGLGVIGYDSDSHGHSDNPFVYSIGAGGIYLAGEKVFFRSELNYRGHSSDSGSNNSNKINWNMITLFVGVGFLF